MTINYDTAVVIGRFQPLHNSHVELIEFAARVAERVVVVVGSHGAPRTAKNPWTSNERALMIHGAMPAYLGSRVVVAPVADYIDDDEWVQAVKRVPYIDGNVLVVGHFKDDSSAYLEWFSDAWDYVDVGGLEEIHATDIRASLCKGDFEAVRNVVPKNVFTQILPWYVEGL